MHVRFLLIYRMDDLNNNLATRFWESTRCANAPNHVDLLLRRLAFGQFKNRILQHHVRIPNPVLCSNYVPTKFHRVDLQSDPKPSNHTQKAIHRFVGLLNYTSILIFFSKWTTRQSNVPTELFSKCSYIVYYVYLQPRNSCRSLPQSKNMSSGGNIYPSNPPF